MAIPKTVSVIEPIFSTSVVTEIRNPESLKPENKEPVKSGFTSFTRRQWSTLIIFGFADLFCAMVYSLQFPFFPRLAESRGMSSTSYGLVFATYDLTVFLTSPIIGKYMNRIGPKIVCNVGIALTAVSCISFGFLDYLDSHFWFTFFAFVLRMTEALGSSSFVTSSFTIIAYEFPESISTAFASLETFYGLGLILGPSVGGALHQLGGFTLPFVVTGGIQLILAVCSSTIMAKIETVPDIKGYGILSILKIPGVAIAALAMVVSSNSMSFLGATLEPHLRQFSLTPLKTGLMFVINGGVYAVTAPAFGWICGKTAKPVYIILFGSFANLLAYLFIGPAPYIHMDTILWVTGAGLFIHGIGLAASQVAVFISALRESLDNGFPDNIATYGVISGMWTSMLSLGSIVGPSFGGFLLDTFGFRKSTYYPMITQASLRNPKEEYLSYQQSQPNSYS